jgi:predicted MFS family arabinose efflux permease
VLCSTQIVSWGSLYYTLPVLAPTIARDTGWGSTWVAASFTGSQLVAAVSSIVVGRAVEADGPRRVMSWGALLGVLGLVGVASAPVLPLFALAWAVAGGAMAAVLYPPAFAALTVWGGPRRLQALTAVTLIAGFASTVFAPLAAFLVGPLGWRQTYLVMAGVLAATAPLLWLTLNHPWNPGSGDAAKEGHESGKLQDRVWRTARFTRLVAALSLAGFSQWAGVFLLVPLLIERGMSTQAAALALGGGGVGQVVGRLGYRRLTQVSGVAARTRAIFAGVATCMLALAVVPGPAAALFVLTFAAGTARGLYTLIQATAVADRWGTAAYASLNGVVSAALLLAGASAPWVGTALARGLGSYALVFGILAAVATTAILTVPPD